MLYLCKEVLALKHSFSIRKRFSSVEHPFSFSLRLTLNFIGSTLLPVLLALFIIMQLISARQTQDTLTAVESHLDSLESNVRVYLNELQRVTLIPYYDENFTYYLSLANTDRQISYPEKVAIRASLENTIHLIRYTRTDLQSVLIAFNDTCLFHSSELMDVPVQGFDYAAEDWYQQAMEAKGSVVFSSPHTPAYYENANAEPVFSIVKALTNLLTRVPYAVIKVDAKATVFQETFDQVSFPVDSRLVLTDANGAIIYASRDFSPEQLNALQREGFPADGPSVLEGWASRHLSRPVSQFGWTIHAFLDQRDLNHGRYSLLSIGLLVYAACVLFMMVSYYMMSRGIVRSIAEIPH